MALNINELDSIILSHSKKQQDPPMFVKTSSGINIADLAKNKDQPGRVFPYSSGTVADSIQYLTLPNLAADVTQVPDRLLARISTNTGDSGAYTGADTGSVQTAGGISQIISRATLKDVRTIELFEKFLRDIYQILLEYAKTQPTISQFTYKDEAEGEMAYGQYDPRMVD